MGDAGSGDVGQRHLFHRPVLRRRRGRLRTQPPCPGDPAPVVFTRASPDVREDRTVPPNPQTLARPPAPSPVHPPTSIPARRVPRLLQPAQTPPRPARRDP